jgi:hypothetical protein
MYTVLLTASHPLFSMAWRQFVVTGAKFPVKQVFPRLLAWLPLRVDMDETGDIVRTLTTLCRDPSVRGDVELVSCPAHPQHQCV